MKAHAFNWLRWLAVAGAIAVVVAIVIAIWPPGPAKVEGRAPRERITCIGRLAADRPAGAGDAIAAAARDDPHALVRQAAIMALSTFADARYRATFEAGTHDVAPWAREKAAEALGRFADDKTVLRLGELLAGDPTCGVRAAAVRALAQIATPPAVELLARAVESNSFPPVRLMALEALEMRYGKDPAPWGAQRWGQLKARVERAGPPAEIDPGAGAHDGPHEHEPQDGHDAARTRPVGPGPGE